MAAVNSFCLAHKLWEVSNIHLHLVHCKLSCRLYILNSSLAMTWCRKGDIFLRLRVECFISVLALIRGIDLPVLTAGVMNEILELSVFILCRVLNFWNFGPDDGCGHSRANFWDRQFPSENMKRSYIASFNASFLTSSPLRNTTTRIPEALGIWPHLGLFPTKSVPT